MTRTTLLVAFLLLAFSLSSLACKPASEGTAVPAPAASPGSDATQSEAAVVYEPAYPTDVSTGELSESDVAQQSSHSHGDSTEHTHGAEDDEHDDEGEDAHGDQH